MDIENQSTREKALERRITQLEADLMVRNSSAFVYIIDLYKINYHVMFLLIFS